jgi:hypothetical protein
MSSAFGGLSIIHAVLTITSENTGHSTGRPGVNPVPSTAIDDGLSQTSSYSILLVGPNSGWTFNDARRIAHGFQIIQVCPGHPPATFRACLFRKDKPAGAFPSENQLTCPLHIFTISAVVTRTAEMAMLKLFKVLKFADFEGLVYAHIPHSPSVGDSGSYMPKLVRSASLSISRT